MVGVYGKIELQGDAEQKSLTTPIERTALSAPAWNNTYIPFRVHSAQQRISIHMYGINKYGKDISIGMMSVYVEELRRSGIQVWYAIRNEAQVDTGHVLLSAQYLPLHASSLSPTEQQALYTAQLNAPSYAPPYNTLTPLPTVSYPPVMLPTPLSPPPATVVHLPTGQHISNVESINGMTHIHVVNDNMNEPGSANASAPVGSFNNTNAPMYMNTNGTYEPPPYKAPSVPIEPMAPPMPSAMDQPLSTPLLDKSAPTLITPSLPHREIEGGNETNSVDTSYANGSGNDLDDELAKRFHALNG